MTKNLQDYISLYKQAINSEICNQTVEQLNIVPWKKHSYNNPVTNESITYNNDLSISYEAILTKQIIINKVIDLVRNYAYKYEINISGLSPLRFNKYDAGTEMRKHHDHIHTCFDGTKKGIPILTILGALNNNYKGGELIMFDDFKINLEEGDIILFPSIFLYPHEVKMITEGIRYSFVCWAW